MVMVMGLLTFSTGEQRSQDVLLRIQAPFFPVHLYKSLQMQRYIDTKNEQGWDF